MQYEIVKQEINSSQNLKELDLVYKKYLGRKGEITLALREVGKLPEKERGEGAREPQFLKKEIESEIIKKSQELRSAETDDGLLAEWLDVSAPGEKVERGHLHPLTQLQNQVNEIFNSLGFEIVEGPEVETEWYNFDALNIPKDHPARDMWDTFWLKSRLLLRTHTSPVQIRYMETHQPPLRIIATGRAFRHEASDASHDIQFYQLEGLMVDKEISVANFKAVISEFFEALFGGNAKIRLRPAYFPFVEPGFEVMMSCMNCNAKGCSVCSGSGWLEMMGAGMVHPNVFKAAGYNPAPPAGGWQGFAFGIGLDRIAMMKYKIDDIRSMYSGDLRFLKQF
ncbi:MAG: phenylalanine--tRNA ligase subunit alpha [Candidatus Spechtbacterales bacterium]